MTKRFTVIIIIANFIMGLLLYLSSQAMLLHLASTHPYLTLTGVDIDKVYIGAVQVPSSPTPLIISAYPNYPFYVLLLPLIVNAYFIVKVVGSSTMPRAFPVFVSVANILMDFLMYLSSQKMLFDLCSTTYLRASGVSFWSVGVLAVQVGSSPIPLIAYSIPNLPSYAFLIFVTANACFMIEKETKQLIQETQTEIEELNAKT
jgi:hypothetical protein